MGFQEDCGKQQQGQTPLVSIIVPVYNHAAYIERCLRGIAMQKCSFSYEVWIGEDCSTDDTREVLKGIEKELPDCFHFLYREQNMGGHGERNGDDLLARCKGKYLAMIEGDDYWTYDLKLQKQVDFLESHPDYSACFHHCTVVDARSQPNGEKYPDCQTPEYTFGEYFYCTMPGQTASFVARNEEYQRERARFIEMQTYRSYASDRRNAFLLLSLGKVHVFQEAWSAYRHVTAAGSSYSARVKINKDYALNEVQFAQTLLAYAERYGSAQAAYEAKRTYCRLILKWSVGSNKVMKLESSLKETLCQSGGLGFLLGVPRWYFVLGVRALMGRGVTL